MTVFSDGEEVPGWIVYGLREAGRPDLPAFPSEVWPGHREPRRFTLYGEAWEVLMWSAPADPWPAPADLPHALRTTMQRLIDVGCRVAWIGCEGLPFCDGPMLLDPTCMSGAVLAWFIDTGSCDVSLDLDAPIRPVDDSVMLMLRAHSAGLADRA